MKLNLSPSKLHVYRFLLQQRDEPVSYQSIILCIYYPWSLRYSGARLFRHVW